MATTFPKLKLAALLDCLCDLGIGLQPADLKTPSAVTVHQIYETLLEHFLQVPLRGLRDNFQLPFTDIDKFEHPELYEQALYHVFFKSALARHLANVGVEDFTFQDLEDPTFKRLRDHLSAVLNFGKFHNEHTQKLADIDLETAEVRETHLMLQDENAGIEERIAAIRLEREEQAAMIAQLEVDNGSLMEEINTLNTKQAAIQEAIRSTKQEATEVKDQVAQLAFKNETLAQDANVIRSQIVSSPERIKAEVVSKGERLNTEQERFESAQQKLRSLTSKLDSLQACEQSLSKMKQLATDALRRKQAVSATSKEVAQLQEQVVAQQSQLQSCEMNEQQLQRQITMAEERLARLVKQQTLKRASATQSLDAVREERERVIKQREEAEAEETSNLDQAEKYQQLLAQVEAEHARNTEEAKHRLSQIDAKLTKYSAHVHSEMHALQL
eukprot:m.195276 g.195276  ORF g.195276 m.195276 type:complete len:443 (+) comp17000_c1_seq2:163-1491(+)